MRIEIISSEINGHQVTVTPPTTSLIELIKALHVVVAIAPLKAYTLSITETTE